MVLVLVLSGKWGFAQIFFQGPGPGPRWSSYQIFKYGRAQVGVLLKFLIMVLVLVLSGEWSFAQILTMVLVPSGVLLKFSLMEIIVLASSGVLLKFSIVVLVPYGDLLKFATRRC